MNIILRTIIVKLIKRILKNLLIGDDGCKKNFNLRTFILKERKRLKQANVKTRMLSSSASPLLEEEKYSSKQHSILGLNFVCKKVSTSHWASFPEFWLTDSRDCVIHIKIRKLNYLRGNNSSKP